MSNIQVISDTTSNSKLKCDMLQTTAGYYVSQGQ